MSPIDSTMKTTLQTSVAAKPKGFSLVEMLVVIAVIGIISAIAVPFILNATSKAGAASNHRTAQTFATMAMNAIASGNLTITEATSAEEVVDMLLDGVAGKSATTDRFE